MRLSRGYKWFKMTGAGVSGVESSDFVIVLVCSPVVLNTYS